MNVGKLSIILPVRNGQATLSQRVEEMLDWFAETEAAFDLLIVDDASCDQTEEIGHELATRFPQVRYTRHARPRGREAAIETGLRLISGEPASVIVHDGTARSLASAGRHPLAHAARAAEESSTYNPANVVSSGKTYRLSPPGEPTRRQRAVRRRAVVFEE